MCQNKKIYMQAIPKQYQIVTSLFHQTKQQLLLKNSYVQSIDDSTSEHLLMKKIHALDSQFANLKSLMKIIISNFQQNRQTNIQNEVIKIKPKYSISNIQSDLRVEQNDSLSSQFESNQVKRPIMVKQQYTENHQNNVRGPYRSYTIQEKQQVLQLHKNGMNYARISKLLRIPQKNIVRWCKTGVYRKQGAGRKIGDMQMQEDLRAYIRANYQLGSEIFGKQIREKAKRLTKKAGFKSSKGWLKNFINRYQLNTQYVIL